MADNKLARDATLERIADALEFEYKDRIDEVKRAGNAAVNAVDDESAKQQANVEAKGKLVLATIPEDYTALAGEMVDSAHVIMPTAEGAEITLTDAAEGYGLREFGMIGKSEQVQTTGAQLMQTPYAYGAKITTGGITFTANDDGSITVDGTATSQANYACIAATQYANTANLMGKTLVIGYYTDKPAPSGVVVQFYNIDGTGKTVKAHAPDNGSSTFVFANDGSTSWNAGISIQTGTTVNKLRIYPMLNYGGTLLPYEPYTGGKPSPSPDYPQPIKSVNKPVVTCSSQCIPYPYDNTSKMENGVNFVVNKDRTITVSGTATDIAIFYLTRNDAAFRNAMYGKLVTLSAQGSSANVYAQIWNADGNNTIYRTVYGDKTFRWENQSGSYNVAVIVPKGSTVSALVKPMLNIGSTALPYTKFVSLPQAATLDLTLRGIGDVHDELTVYADGTGEIKRNIGRRVFTGAEQIGKNARPTFTRFEIHDENEKTVLREICCCNYWRYNGFYNANSVWVNDTNKPGFEVVFNIPDMTLAEFRQLIADKYSSGSPVEIIYVAGSPTTETLTAEQVQQVLALNTLSPTTIITNDQGAEMSVTYVADHKAYIDGKFKELSEAILASKE